MPSPKSDRWTQNEDGSYTRTVNGIEETTSDRFSVLTKEELSAELESRGLPKTGSKDELIARLQEAEGVPA